MRYIITLAGYCLCIHSALFSQQFTVENYGLANGLNSPKIETIVQDSQGFIWAGTYLGISRFDGQHFINYTSAEGQRIGTIFCIREYEKSVLLLGGMEGLFVKKGNTIKAIPWPSEEGITFSVNEMTIDEEKNVWVATTLGPLKIPAHILRTAIDDPSALEELSILNAWTNSRLEDKRCARIKLDSIGNVWIANDYYLTKYYRDSLHILYDSYGKESLKITSIFPYSADSVLWAAPQSYMYKTIQGVTSAIWNPIKHPQSIIIRNQEYIVLTAFDLFSVKQDSPQKLINLQDENVFFPRELLLDSEDNFWIASHSGLYKLVENNFKQLTQTAHASKLELYGIELLDSGQLLLGGNYGTLYQKDPDKPSAAIIRHILDTRSELVDFHEDQHSTLWIASNYRGLFRIHKNGIQQYTEDDGLINNGLKCIFESSQQELWLGGELGVTKLEIINQGQIQLSPYKFGNDVANYFQVNQIIEGPGSKLWVGTNFGLFHIKDDTLQPYPLSIDVEEELDISDCIRASNGFTYIATKQNGILECRFNSDQNPEIITNYTKENELSTNTFIDILETKAGQIWAVGYNEICLISDIKNSSFTSPICFNKNNGFGLESYASIKMIEDTSGLIWLASTNGLSSIDPTLLKKNEQAPYLHIYDVLIDGRQEDLVQFGTGIDSISGLVTDLSLPYYKNYISFHVNAISMRDLADVSYTYQLIGIDKEPQISSTGGIINYPNLPSGHYTFKLNASNSFGISQINPLEYTFEIRPAFWKTSWFTVTCLLLGFLAVRYYFKRKEALYKKAEAEKNKVNKLIAELKIRAIRSQMNPHFMFNCLNAIQASIVAQNLNIASTYLSKFSKLLRMVLNYSEKDYIPLDKEVAFLDLYLELEKLRFGKSLEYAIELSEDIDPEEIMLPSFLIQPFIENSIWHGLMHKADNRKLWIRFYCLDNQDLLCCEIEDNGIGRDRSAELKKKNTSRIQHQSKGMRLSTERIELIKLQSDEKINFKIEDLKDQNQTPTGTKVILTLPMNYE